MSRRTLRWMKRASVLTAAGMVLGPLSCVQNVTQVVGSGLTFTGATGVLGPGSSGTATVVGEGLEFFAELVRLATGG